MTADRHLLLGLLALQNGLIDQAKLVAAFQAWTLDRSKSLADHLVALGYLDESRRTLIESLANVHLEHHGGDAAQSLATITAGQSTWEKLSEIGDTDLNATLTHVGQSSTRPDPTTTAQVGTITSVGQRFRVIRPHAKGGLGAVFVAIDSELNREVALKQILDDHADDPTSRGRFLVEAEITGGLEHPGIVPVYGLGTYSDGRPYYAMRFVRGDSLREAIEKFHQGGKPNSERSLEFRHLLRKFTDVCNAIDYAHSRGVLHRDIKPGNVIVGKHGETLTVDWGLAKALGKSAPDAVERTLIPSSGDGSSETLPGEALGTPAYMSPEQARGDLARLGPRSDVYSLGATLYCLLTGKAPFQGPPLDVLKAVEAGDFRRPRERDATIDPALEAIVLKAMAKEPADRYKSARALADDVDRWLADERVEAYREPWTRRLNRWLTRHRTGVTSIAAAGIVALIGLGVVSVVQTQARRDLDFKNAELVESNKALDEQRQQAEESEAQAIDAVKRFKDAIVDNPSLKSDLRLEDLRKTLLREPLAYFGKLRERLQANQNTRAEAMFRFAGVVFEHARLTEEIGDKQDALQAYRQALDVYERLDRDHPTVADYQDDLAACLANLGGLLRVAGQTDDSRTAYHKAIDILERLARDHSTITDYQASLARCHNNLGALLCRLAGQTDEARTAYRRAIEIYERLIHDHPTITDYQADLARGHHNLGVLLLSMGRIDEARTAYHKAIEIRERLVRDHPTITEYQADLARSHNNLGDLLDLIGGQTDDAQKAYRRAIEIGERLIRDHPTVTEYQANLASYQNNLGVLLDQIGGQTDEARTAHRRATEIGERLVRDHPTVTEYQASLASYQSNLGNQLRATGQTDDARKAFERAIEIYERLVRDHPEVPDRASGLGAALHNLASIDFHASRFAEARDRLLQAISWQRKALAANPRHPQYRQFYQNHLRGLIEAERGLGHEEEAGRIARELAEFQLHDRNFEAIDARIQAIRDGAASQDDAERLRLAQRAYDTKQFAIAARLWGEAIDSDPRLTENRETQLPYNAACAAALAASGQGADPPVDDAEKARLRGRALAWLQSELAVWTRIIASSPPQNRPALVQTLKHWKQDTDLASVRDTDSLARLSEEERGKWSNLWTSLDEQLLKAEAVTEAPKK